MTHPYATRAYADTLAHVGQPLEVTAWDTCVLVRSWRESTRDAAGTYPLACLAESSDISAGLSTLRNAGLVSIVLVVDGLRGPPIERLASAFSYTRPWKTHYVIDPSVAPYKPSPHHAYEIRRALRKEVTTHIVPLRQVLGEWCALYEQLSERHKITGAANFSHEAFERLAACDGFIAVAGFGGGKLVSCHIYAVEAGYAVSHLAATSAWGYANGAAYLVEDAALREFQGCLINLGGSAGFSRLEDDGLARFKAGFANRTHQAFIAGAILDKDLYARLTDGTTQTDFFPAYRAPIIRG